MSKGGSSNKVMIVVLAGSVCVASALKFKRRRMSAIWDFPPSCGRVTAPNFGIGRQIIVDRSTQGSGDHEFLVFYVIRDSVGELFPTGSASWTKAGAGLNGIACVHAFTHPVLLLRWARPN
ncbi:hypothetical protein PVK06_020369 [Gossypium arboreum]|uniref:Uncharacterized protein n=1 Tax=Gossypium arboreum TaxID=29729 RepID=A0ABR0PMU6_GOSAR|nr:hypothetical protein PVK06_020369 [Gossypium arboreum]